MRIKISVLGLVMLVCAPAARAASPSLELTDRCEIGGSYVRLEDVATVRSAPAELAAACRSIFLGPAPAAGASRTITREEIRAELRKCGLNPDAILFEGPESVVVGRPVEGAAPAEGGRPCVREQARLAIEAWLAGRRPESDPPCRVSVEGVGGEVYPSEILPDIASSGEWPAEAVVLAVSCDMPGIPLGPARFLLTVAKSTGEEASLVPVKAIVKQIHRVLVATRPLRTGHRLVAADLEPSRMEFTAAPSVYTNPGQILGQPLTQAVGQGAAIPVEAVKAVPVIKARQPVSFRLVRDGYALSLSGLVAVQAGAVGDVIAVKDAATGTVKHGRVIGPGLLEPAEDSAPTPVPPAVEPEAPPQPTPTPEETR